MMNNKQAKRIIELRSSELKLDERSGLFIMHPNSWVDIMVAELWLKLNAKDR